MLKGYIISLINNHDATIATRLLIDSIKQTQSQIDPVILPATTPDTIEEHFDELVSSYKEQINGLHEGGCDILFIETVFDTLNAKAALMAVDNYFEEKNVSIPVMLSGTITDKSGRTLSGQTVNAFLISISHFPLLSVGFNCALGTKDLKPYMKRLSDSTDFYTSSHPNAGLPNAFGEYDQSPENMIEQMKEYLDENLVNIIGGCCGTTYEHIELLSEVVKKYKPRKLPNV